ncbi:MAG TPA: PBP1A family penicillin-binding protein [Stellaceae bacterium]|nr:PBP1A family penicillin-binding protein [Stellaceae bacterium]
MLRCAGVLFAWGLLLAAGLAAYVYLNLPTGNDWMRFEHKPSVTLLADDGSTIATYGDVYGQTLHLADMPKALPEAVIATEDRRFYSHFGIDPIGLLRALWVDIRTGHMIQGGSTITQQLAKNVFLTPQRTLSRKLQEAVIAVWLEQHYTKDQLLEIYLNRVYLGAGAYGVDAAARRYFGKSARDLDTFQCAVIAGLLRAPSYYSPAHDPGLAAKRARVVLENMVHSDYLTQAQADTAAAESKSLTAVLPNTKAGPRYFADWVQDQLADDNYTGDVTVETTLDPIMQQAAQSIIASTLDKEGPRYHATQGMLLAMSPDGAIRAMVGGKDYATSQFNRVTQAERQPGSSFKLFVYLTALEAGMHPSDTFFDGPISIGNWHVHDYEPGFLGNVTMGEAVAQSLNTVAVEVAQRVGVANVVDTAHRLGITSDLPRNLSIALGTGEVSMLDLTSAYAVMANGGYGVWPYGIVEVKDAQGKVLYRRTGGGPGRLVAPNIVAEMNRLLAGVIAHGTGKAAAIGRPAAGKTGTTSDFRDAWFEGYTPDLVTGVWFGNDDNSPMRRATGGIMPAQAWHAFMMEALKDVPPNPLPGLAAPPPPNPAVASNNPAQGSSGPDVGDAIGNFLSRGLAAIGIGDGPKPDNNRR